MFKSPQQTNTTPQNTPASAWVQHSEKKALPHSNHRTLLTTTAFYQHVQACALNNPVQKIQDILVELSNLQTLPCPHSFSKTLQELYVLAQKAGLAPGTTIAFTPKSIANAKPIILKLGNNPHLGFQPIDQHHD